MKKLHRIVVVCLVLTASAVQASALPLEPNWQFAGWHGGGAFPMIVPDPSVAGRVYMISDIGGIWKSDNRGDQWVPITNGLANLKIVNLAVSPSNPSILYCGTSIGVHRSDNAGQDWVLSQASKSRVMFSRPSGYRSLAVHPADPNRVCAGTKDGQVFYTADGGATWNNLGVQLPFGTSAAISSLLYTQNGAYLFAGTASGLRRYNFSTGVWETTSFPAGPALDLCADGSPEKIFATNGTRVAWSANAGASWTLTAAPPASPGTLYRLSAEVTAQGTRIFTASRDNWNGGAFLSTDGGVTWTNVERGLTYDTVGNPTRVWHRGFEWPLSALIDPHDPAVLYFSDFWGAWRSDDGGVTWNEKVRGAPNTIGSDITVGTDGRLWVASMDNGLMVSSDNGTTYQAMAPNSQSDTSVMGHVWRVLAHGSRVVATNSPWDAGPNQVLVSENGGASFTKTRNGLPAAYPTSNVVWDKGYARALARDPVQTNRYYLGIDGDTGGFYYSVDSGYNWTRSAGQPASLRIYNGLAVDPVEPIRLYWATVGNGGGVYRSENYGLNWLKVFSGSAYVFDVAVAPDGTVYAAADTAGPVLYVSRNKGTSWSQLKAFGGSGTCEGIAIDPGNSSRIAVSTIKWDGYTPCKIYITENAGTTWTDITANLPYGSGAAAMTFSPDGKYLNIVRDAGSAWRLSLVDDTVAPSAPGSLSGAASGNSVNLSWTASTDNVGVTGYKLYRGGVFLADSAGLSYSDTSASLGTTYVYTVKAVDAAGNLSAASNAANFTLTDTTPPSVPQSLALAVSGERTVTLSWTASTDNGAVARYDVFRNGVLLGPSSTTSYADSTGAYGVAYSYTVKAVDAAGNASAASGAVSVTLVDTTPPAAPQNLVSFIGNGITLSWEAPTDNVAVTGYRVYRNTVLLANCQTASYTDTLAGAGVSYTYTVCALDAAGNVSALSAPVTAMIADATSPSTPADLAASVTGTTASLTWTASTDDSGVTGYKVYRDGVFLAPSAGNAYADEIRVPGTVEEMRPGKSAYLNGSSNLTLPRSNDWDFGTGDFTIDHWYRFDSLKHTYFWTRLANGGSGTEMALRWITSNQIDFYLDDVAVVSTAWTPSAGVWYHLTVSRSGGAVRFFVDGVQVGATGTSFAAVSSDQPFVIGSLGGNFPKGWVDEFRVSKGVARWSANFTPFVERYAPDAQTKLLLRAGYSAAEPFKDVSASAHLVQSQGTVVDETQYKLQETVSVESMVPPPPGSTFSYTVSAVDDSGNESALSAAVSVTLADTQAPTAPSGLGYALTGTRTVNLSWTASTDDGIVTGYNILRNGVVIGNPAGTAYADSVTVFGETYDYAVRAADSAGNLSPLSPALRVMLADTTPPGAPENLRYTLTGMRTDLAWDVPTDNDAVVSYRVFKNGVLLANLATNAASDNVVIGTSTLYFVRAVDPSGNVSAPSDTVSVFIPDTQAPTVPEGLTAQVTGGISTTLSWAPSTDDAAVTGYKVYRDGTFRGTAPSTEYSDDIRVGGTQEELLPGKSAYFNGSSMLTLPRSTDWDFDRDDFTIDHWYRFDGLKHTYFWTRLANGASGTEMALRWVTWNQIDLYLDDVAVVTAAWVPRPGVWYHLAVSRTGSAVRFFVDGVQVGPTGTSSARLSSNQPFVIGSQGGNFPKGWVDEFRISKGAARWSANFAPSTERYAPDSLTVLLLRAGVSPAEPFKDVSTSAHPVQSQGAVVDTSQYRVSERVVVSSPVPPPSGTVFSYTVSAADAAGNESAPSPQTAVTVP